MLIKIFVSDNCPNCPQSKELGRELIAKGLNVEFHNVKTPDGLAESLMFDIMGTPSTVIIKNSKVLESFPAKTPKIEEVMKWL